MINWLKRLFPATPDQFRPKVVEDLPTWTESDASQLDAFLQSRAGKHLMDRMKYTITAMCLDSRELDKEARADRRAMAWVIEGIDSLADTDFWHKRDRERELAERKLEPSRRYSRFDDDDDSLAE